MYRRIFNRVKTDFENVRKNETPKYVAVNEE